MSSDQIVNDLETKEAIERRVNCTPDERFACEIVFARKLRLTEAMDDMSDLAADLALATGRGELYAAFQPQISLETGAIVAVEGLCRWLHPERGLIAPDIFIPVAERTGSINEIGAFMMDECIAAADAWQRAGMSIGVSVNVSPVQLADGSASDGLAQQARRSEGTARLLTMEITESLPLKNLAVVVPRLKDLRSIGMGIALDDIGSGHASIDQLDDLPITELKLDRSLIQSEDAATALVLATIMTAAVSRGLRVVAEGIETAAHLELARSLGCDRAQGFLLGMPMPRSDVDRLLAA